MISIEKDYEGQKQSMRVISKEIEGELLIKEVIPLRLKTSKLVISIFLILISFLGFALALRNSLILRMRALYSQCSVEQATHFYIINSDDKQQILKKCQEKDNSKSKNSKQVQFINRHLKYAYDPETKCFSPVYFRSIEKLPIGKLQQLTKKGLSEEKVIKRFQKYGPCKIEVPIPTLFEYLAEVLTNIFFIFQYLCLILWVLEGYTVFAIAMISASGVISLFNYYLLRLSLSKLKSFANNKQEIKVIRNGLATMINSTELLPGDIYFVTNKMPVPCDSFLLKGLALLNESSLTGESIPISKTPSNELQDQNACFEPKKMKHQIMFEGTKVIQVTGAEVLAMALYTGYTSYRGGIFRAMLYPKSIKFDFYKNGIYFMLIMMIFGLITYFAMLQKVISINVPTRLIIYRFFDAATWIIPPGLPIFFNICQTVGLIRLGRKSILATDPAKVVVAGDITVMCFDKTGTLTKETMEVYGFTDHNCSNIIQKIEQQDNENIKILQKAMGTCHGVYLVEGAPLGDELDIKMLEFSGYQIQPTSTSESKNNDQPKAHKFQVKFEQSVLNVIQVWDFESELQRMGCIIQDQSNSTTYSIIKGSPEVISQMCDKKSFDQQKFILIMNSLTTKGLRIIAFGTKVIPNYTNQFSRADAETNLQFQGLLILENKLKDDTSLVISKLRKGNIACKVISGDNLLTTLQCAREAGIVQSDTEIDNTYTEINGDMKINQSKVSCERKRVILCNSLEDSVFEDTQEQVDIMQLLTSSHSNVSQYSLAISGQFLFQYLEKHEIFQNSNSHQIQSTPSLYHLLKYGSIFARFKPEQKAQIIHLMQVVLKLKIGMIGDGANDCPAIKQADIGISFTKSDASYSSPFSYSKSSLECTLVILAEGRCILASMIEIYKYYLSVSIYKYTIACIMILEYSYLTSFVVVFINYFESIPFLVILSINSPLKNLSPFTAISNMLDIQNFVSIWGQIILGIAEFFTVYFHLRAQDWFIPITDIGNSTVFISGTMTGHILYLTCVMVFVFSILSYFISYPSKERIYKNKILAFALSLLFIYGVVLKYKNVDKITIFFLSFYINVNQFNQRQEFKDVIKNLELQNNKCLSVQQIDQNCKI